MVDKPSPTNYHQEYYLKNKDTILPKSKEYQKHKYNNDLKYKLIKRYQSRLDNHFNKQLYKAEDVLKCNAKFFKKWICFCITDTQLYGEPLNNIHLHHVKPINSFTKDNVLQAFHWTNVLPVTEEMNIALGDQRDKVSEKQQTKRVLRFLKKIKLEST